MPSFKSKKQLDEERQFTLLPQDDYELLITKCEEKTQNKYNAKPDKNGNIPQEDIVNITLEIVACKDGAEALDDDGRDARGRKIFFTARPESAGFMKDGTPAKTRCLVAYALDLSVEDDIEFEAWEQLLGKTLFAEIIQKLNTKGQKKNAISRFVLPPKNRRSVKERVADVIEDKDIPVVEE